MVRAALLAELEKREAFRPWWTTPEIDFRHPDYDTILAERAKRLARIRATPHTVEGLKTFYRENPAQFISDWGMTLDPRNVEVGMPALVPFILFPRQAEFVDAVMAHWRARRPLLAEKTRDMGLSWVAVALACTLCLFYPGMGIGFGSRKEEYVDKIDGPKSLFYKARVFMANLPPEFRGGWVSARHAPHMRLIFPESGSNIGGEAGDNIGRGDRTGIYFVDEAAHLERPQLVEASLSQTTNCRVDISSANGMLNPFAQKRHGGKIDVFTFHWRDDPRKDDAWYARQVQDLDPVTLAQEVDIDYSASVEGVLIPQKWVRAAVDAHTKLGIAAAGMRSASLDVADEGIDLNAMAGAHGIVLDVLEEWSGSGGDIYRTVQRAFDLCDAHGYDGFRYDADGLGAGCRGDARVINETRTKKLTVQPFRGSDAVDGPDREDVRGRTNKDFFANRKAQAWWSLRTRFQKTYRRIAEGIECPPDEMISISSALPLAQKLCTELSQPTYSVNAVGKIVIDKAPDGSRSPNLADAVMIQFSGAVRRRGLVFTAADLARI